MHSSNIRKMTQDAATVTSVKPLLEPYPLQDADVLDVSHQRLDLATKDSSSVYLATVTDRFSGCIVHLAVIAVDNGVDFRSGTNPLNQPRSRRKDHMSPPATPWAKGTVESAFRQFALDHLIKAGMRPRKPASRIPKGNKNAI